MLPSYWKASNCFFKMASKLDYWEKADLHDILFVILSA